MLTSLAQKEERFPFTLKTVDCSTAEFVICELSCRNSKEKCLTRLLHYAIIAPDKTADKTECKAVKTENRGQRI